MKHLRTLLPLAAIVALPTIGMCPRLAAEEFNPSALYDKCVKSSVFIVTPMKQGIAMGSGSLIDAEKRYVLTNYHVVEDVDLVHVQFPVRLKDGSIMTDKKKYFARIPDGQALKGKVLYRDKTRDLAILQLDRLPPDTHALPLAKKSVATGEPVINIGNPGAVDWTFSTTQGNVRGIGVADWVVGGGDEVLRIKARMITITNPINPGDSGGPLIDRRGFQVGVSESGKSGVQNVNNCVDITEVWAFLNEKKLVIKDLTGEPAEVKTQPKVGPGSAKTQPKEFAQGSGAKDPTPGSPTPPKKEATPAADPAAPSAADEQTAAAMLQRAKLFKDGDDKSYFAGKLKDIVAKYPTTAAGKEAKKLLDAMK